MRIVAKPEVFTEDENLVYIQVSTDIEINHPMFVQSRLDFPDIYRWFEFYKEGKKKFEYAIAVKEGNELDVYKLIAKYFLDWLNELKDRDLTVYEVSPSFIM